MDFKAEVKEEILVVKPIVEKKPNKDGGTDVIIHMPTANRIKEKIKEVTYGKRNIQQIQSKSNE